MAKLTSKDSVKKSVKNTAKKNEKKETIASSAKTASKNKKTSRKTSVHEHSHSECGCGCSSEKLTVGVFFGGRSSEHEVSLVSAKSILNAINRKNYNVIPIGITKDGNFKYLKNSEEPADIIKKGHTAIFIPQPKFEQNLWIMNDKNNEIEDILKIDIAFPVLHGPYGEDGKIQGLFEMANIAYIGSDVLGSACGMDKTVMKNLFLSQNLPTPNYMYFEKADFEKHSESILSTIKEILPAPWFIKPANLGSSVGITKVEKAAGLKKAIAEALKYDYKVIVEQGINAREIEVAIMGNFDLEIAAPGEVIPKAAFYDYNDKYKNGQAEFEIPVKLPAKKIKEIKEMAEAAYKAVNARGFSRVDLFLERESGQVYVNEINTIPGFTAISMFPKMFEKSGVKYSKVIDKLIEYAWEMYIIRKGLSI